MRPIFVTGNQRKADYLNQLLGIQLDHEKVDLDEIQSINLEDVVRHKASQAYHILQKPVLVEDVALCFKALNGLPGPFIKFFVNAQDGLEVTCRMLDGFSDRSATATSMFAYYDGNEYVLLKGELHGIIAKHPSTAEGWDWDKIFCPDGYGGKPRAELSKQHDDETYMTIKPIGELRKFLENKKYAA